MQKGLKLKQVLNITNLPKSSFYYKSSKKEDLELIEKIKNIAYDKTFYGYRKIHQNLIMDNIKVNHKRVYNIYCKMNLQKKKKEKYKRIFIKDIKDYKPEKAAYPNHIWALDFIFISIENNKKIKILTVEDLYSRKAIHVYADVSITSNSLICELEKTFNKYGKPQKIKTDNGSEFISNSFISFLNNNRIIHDRIPRGSPYLNGINERFNRTIKYELYFVQYISNLIELRELTESYLIFYNKNRPHQSLNNKTPDEVYFGENPLSYYHSTNNNNLIY